MKTQKIEPILFTKTGYENLKKEKQELLEQRKDAVTELSKARAMGDLSENGYYKSAKQKLSSIDHRLYRLAVFLRFGKIADRLSSNIVDIGCAITVTDGKNTRIFHMVGAQEADPSQKKLSHVSPIGKALMGKRVKDTVTVSTPSGNTTYTILAISCE